MFSVHDLPSRREWLCVGGLSAVGLTLPALLGSSAAVARAAPPVRLEGTTFGRAKNVIYLWLQGGPPQHETFDPKPDAPAEIRGLFRPIATNVPGIRFCELLPRTARHADKLAVIRSMATDDDNHDVSGYWVLTGYPYGPGSARQIKPTDWPYFGSLVKLLRPSERLPALSTVWLPDVMRLNDAVTPAGQTAGFLGKTWEPERFVGDPAASDYHIEGLSLAGELPRLRVDRRGDLLKQLDRHFKTIERGGGLEAWDRHARNAHDLVTSGRARAAFDLDREPTAVRDRYGRHTWGQSVLLARRLIEAGVRLVHVNWSREPGDSSVDNPMWDTHAQNADRLQDALCPQFDVTFDALLEDLAQRGLLGETLVVVVGEFGRTPRINASAGRDHWGRVFSMALAGAGIRGGQVYGASDKNGGFPVSDPVRPHDLTATLFHLLGIDPVGMFRDRADRPHALTRGEPMTRLLGDGPATRERCPPGGDLAFLPAYDTQPLLDTDFALGKLLPPTPFVRDKGWRAWPLASSPDPNGLTVEVAAGRVVLHASGSPVVGAKALLAQEIRHARGGHFIFEVRAAAPDDFADHFACRLVLFRFADVSKDPRNVRELGSAAFRPGAGEPRTFAVSRSLVSGKPGMNFAIGNGLGVAVVVERTSTGPLPPLMSLTVSRTTLTFQPQPRDETFVD